ncbi:MAG TPA: YMGG-like glycine zipper-containing protein [Gemmatimonadaceae bacterium]|nr:YMGG-like glycine zipper-containing protein [Gemmatimonadaceae bacterium]
MFKKLLILPAAALAFACSKADKQTAADSALNSDLSTAAASRPYTPLDSITAAERAGTATSTAALRSNATAPRTVYRAPVRRTTTRRSSSGGTYSSAPAPAPAPVEVKHTKRDAAIGAGAGAVIGAVTSRNKVKGAIIGGAAGAILGGIIGNNVDKTKK